jgi:hypothetical protein
MPRRGLLAALLLVVLTGCVATTDAPPPPTAGELEALTRVELDLQWQYIGLTPDIVRPAVMIERYIDVDEIPIVVGGCMEDAGYPDYASATGNSISATDDLLRLALYTCVARYPLDPAVFGIYSLAERERIYDYYRDRLVPCIEAAGYQVDAPSRADFLERTGGFTSVLWTPFDGVVTRSAAEEALLDEACPDESGRLVGTG